MKREFRIILYHRRQCLEKRKTIRDGTCQYYFKKHLIRQQMDKWIDFNGAQGYYKVEGKGKPVMLVHGFIEEGNMWNGLLPSLTQKYKVIVPDLPGFGKSALPAQQLSMEYYAEYLHAIAQAEKLNHFVLLGHSMGGYITLNFAEKYAGLLQGFGLINSHCFEDSPQKKENRLKGIDFVQRNGTQYFIRELYYSIFNESFKKKNKQLIDALIAQARQYSPEAVTQAMHAMMNRNNKSAVLKKATVPVLFINGEDDESAPVACTLEQAAYPANTDFNLFSGCKHMSVFEKKAETLKIVDGFCERFF